MLALIVALALAGPADPAAADPRADLAYGAFLAASSRIEPPMPRQAVLDLLGQPDRVEHAQPPEDWFDERWIYDLDRLEDYPAGSRDAVWHVEILLLRGAVVHTRHITWLE